MLPIRKANDLDNVVYPTGHGIILTGYAWPNNLRGVGSYRIATYLRKKGWDIDVLDYIFSFKPEQLDQYLESTVTEKTKWIGFSYTWLSYGAKILDIIKHIREKYPNLCLIMGGQEPYEEEIDADWFILGYAEYAIDAVLCYEFSNGPLPKSKPLYSGRYIDAYHDYPATPFKSYTVEYQPEDFLNEKNSLALELSRGCRFACKFCNFPFLGIKEDTSSDEEELYRELMDNYEKHGVSTYFITDDTYNDRLEKMIKLKNVVNRLPFDPDFKAYIRLDLLKVHPEQLEILAESRVWVHLYGIETFNKKAGAAIGKGQDGDTKKRVLLETKDYFTKHIGYFRATASLIAGLPHESLDSCRETQAWLKQYWADQHVDWWTLAIYKNMDYLSAFGEDLSKYGYSVIPEEEVLLRTKKQNYDLRDSAKKVYWRNKLTDIYECEDLVNEFKQGDEVLDAYSTIRYLKMYNMDYQKVLNIRRNIHARTDTFEYRKKSLLLINEYIGKKLSLTKK